MNFQFPTNVFIPTYHEVDPSSSVRCAKHSTAGLQPIFAVQKLTRTPDPHNIFIRKPFYLPPIVVLFFPHLMAQIILYFTQL